MALHPMLQEDETFFVGRYFIEPSVFSSHRRPVINESFQALPQKYHHFFSQPILFYYELSCLGRNLRTNGSLVPPQTHALLDALGFIHRDVSSSFYNYSELLRSPVIHYTGVQMKPHFIVLEALSHYKNNIRSKVSPIVGEILDSFLSSHPSDISSHFSNLFSSLSIFNHIQNKILPYDLQQVEESAATASFEKHLNNLFQRYYHIPYMYSRADFVNYTNQFTEYFNAHLASIWDAFREADAEKPFDVFYELLISEYSLMEKEKKDQLIPILSRKWSNDQFIRLLSLRDTFYIAPPNSLNDSSSLPLFSFDCGNVGYSTEPAAQFYTVTVAEHFGPFIFVLEQKHDFDSMVSSINEHTLPSFEDDILEEETVLLEELEESL